MGKIMVARDSGVADIDGVAYPIHKGVTRVDSEHPLVRSNPDMWEELTLTYEIETATKAPGEKRTSTKKVEKADEK